MNTQGRLAMLRHSVFAAIVLAATSVALADPWKDESGKGRGRGGDWKEWKGEWKDRDDDRGETPWWARGRGYWDGHFKNDFGPPVYIERRYYYRPAPYQYYGPPAYYDRPWREPAYEELPPPLPY
jgi:hypothetical protein